MQVLISCFSGKNILKTPFSLPLHENQKIRLKSPCVTSRKDIKNLLKNSNSYDRNVNDVEERFRF